VPLNNGRSRNALALDQLSLTTFLQGNHYPGKKFPWLSKSARVWFSGLFWGQSVLSALGHGVWLIFFAILPNLSQSFKGRSKSAMIHSMTNCFSLSVLKYRVEPQEQKLWQKHAIIRWIMEPGSIIISRRNRFWNVLQFASIVFLLIELIWRDVCRSWAMECNLSWFANQKKT
jgi:hypothetical protein